MIYVYLPFDATGVVHLGGFVAGALTQVRGAVRPVVT
jgi:hypothetical protein